MAAPSGAPASSLRELLCGWGIRGAERVSSKWRCVLAPRVQSRAASEGGVDTDGLLRHIARGTPCLLPLAFAEDAHKAAEPDGLALVTDPSVDVGFARPRLAMLGGWGAPGTELVDDEHVTFVSSFHEALDSPHGCVNLQCFHREMADAVGQAVPFPSRLRWPLPEIIFGEPIGADPRRTPLGSFVDMATRVSKAGAVTWWHLDDGGECTLQAALPMKEAARSLAEPVLRDLDGTGNIIVKLFIFLPREAYTLVFDDVESNKSGRWASLDLFDTPDDALPDASRLPPVVIAPLAAGGFPLLSPPNAPHFVITLQDCCMVEQRAVLHAHLDEAWHFLKRCKSWSEPPIVYPVLRSLFGETDTKDLKSEEGRAAKGHAKAIYASPIEIAIALTRQCVDETLPGIWRSRVAASLLCLLQRGNVKELDVPNSRYAETFEKDLASTSLSRQDVLESSCEGARGVVRLCWSIGDSDSSPGGWCSVIHERGRPRFGPERDSLAAAVEDRKQLIAARRKGRDALTSAMRARHAQ